MGFLRITPIIASLLALSLSACDLTKLTGSEPSEGSLVPTGEYAGEWVLKDVQKMTDLAEGVDKSVKITLFPIASDHQEGNGILWIQNASRRFYWQASGNHKDSWNILFSKDNNVFTDLTTSFNFDGLLSLTKVGIDFMGSLNLKEKESNEDYFLRLSKVFKPELLAAEALSVTVGEVLTIDGKYFGDDSEVISMHFKNKADAKELTLKPSGMKEQEKSEQLLLETTKTGELQKGDYTLYITRSEEKSNSISVSVI